MLRSYIAAVQRKQIRVDREQLFVYLQAFFERIEPLIYLLENLVYGKVFADGYRRVRYAIGLVPVPAVLTEALRILRLFA